MVMAGFNHSPQADIRVRNTISACTNIQLEGYHFISQIFLLLF